ncbi:MAG: phosphoribosyltransferase [Spirochaetales bacterium]|uniref:Phosphoribosyltransferase n=1 Tax=Candidatus Thalassospirochaeta sargassi TaxID=3119039 RepID=A0AAJ1ID95_9SPIO|nr:phosphoribosyltransferase [Spirochaetales bacterium]
MSKIFLEYNTVRNNAIKLAHKILKDGFVPDVIYVSLRGGAYIGNVISEYFKIVRIEKPVLYAAVVARSYVDIHDHDEVRIDGWTYNPEHLRQGDKVLLVDDIYDSGRTINYLADVLLSRGVPKKDLKVAVHDYKYFSYKDHTGQYQPDYYCVKHDINTPEEDVWIHYMSHELVGLKHEELENNYYKEDRELREALDILE